MSNLQTWPPKPVDRPFWRGVSDLYGPTGDPLYGYYDRSENIHVRDLASVESRRGYERAADELFFGPPGVAVARDDSTFALVAVDAQGIKILSSLPQTEFAGFSIDHPGFVADEFTRANNASIQTNTTLPWIEGRDSDEVAGRAAEDEFEIVSNQMRLQYADGPSGYADWDIEAPTPYHTMRLELDMSAVALSTNQAATVMVFMGLPGAYYDGAGLTLVKERIYAVDAQATHTAGPGGADHAWCGLGARFKITAKSGTHDEAALQLFEFASNKPNESFEDRQGRRAYDEEKVGAQAVQANIRVTWVLEVGRRLVEGKWVTRAEVYRDKTIAQVEAGDVSTRYLSIESVTPREINGTAGGGFMWNIPRSGKGGYAGIRLHTVNTPSGGSIRCERIKSALEFVRYEVGE